MRRLAVSGFARFATLGLAALLSWPGGAARAQPVTAGREVQVNTDAAGDQFEPAVAAGGDDSFVVVWNSSSDTRQSGMQGQRFDRSGAPIGDQFSLRYYGYEPALAANAAGGFVVAHERGGPGRAGVPRRGAARVATTRRARFLAVDGARGGTQLFVDSVTVPQPPVFPSE